MSTALTADLITRESHGLSQTERVVDTFLAPAKTFTDILRSTSWWLPFLLMVLVSLTSAAVVQHQVGFERVTENQIHSNPKQEEKLNGLAPDQRARQISITSAITKYITYSMPLLLLGGFALYSLILLAGFNFGLGAQTTFSQVFAVTFYAALPYLLINLLTIATLYLGGNAESYDYKNPVGTNLGYYMSDAAPWLKAFLGSLDLVKLWSLALQVIGMAIVARKTITQSALIVVGWWFIVLLGSVGITAVTS